MVYELTDEKIYELKQKYGKLYKTTLDTDQVVVWHPLSRSEHRRIAEETETITSMEKLILERQERSCLACVVFPEPEIFKSLMEEYAGIAKSISDEIYDHSGFDVKKETEEL